MTQLGTPIACKGPRVVWATVKPRRPHRHGNLKYYEGIVAEWARMVDGGMTPREVAVKLRLPRGGQFVREKIAMWKRKRGG